MVFVEQVLSFVEITNGEDSLLDQLFCFGRPDTPDSAKLILGGFAEGLLQPLQFLQFPSSNQLLYLFCYLFADALDLLDVVFMLKFPIERFNRRHSLQVGYFATEIFLALVNLLALHQLIADKPIHGKGFLKASRLLAEKLGLVYEGES